MKFAPPPLRISLKVSEAWIAHLWGGQLWDPEASVATFLGGLEATKGDICQFLGRLWGAGSVFLVPSPQDLHSVVDKGANGRARNSSHGGRHQRFRADL